MTNLVPLAEQGLEPDDIEIAISVLRSGNHTMGRKVVEFEEAFASYLGSKCAIMLNSGSSANLLALQVMRMSIDDSSTHEELYIAVPAVLWPTSLWPIVQSGFTPLFIDSEPGAINIDLEILTKAHRELKSQLVGAVVIHALGKSLDLSKLQALRDDGLLILEDTCESLGAGNGGSFAGSVGNFGSFSFYFSHHITTIEGGMLLTDSDVVANQIRSLRAHGWIRERTDRATLMQAHSNLSPDFLFVESGYNLRPMEIQAALGLSQLRKIDKFLNRRVYIARFIKDSLKSNALKLISRAEDFDLNAYDQYPHTWMTLPFLAETPQLKVEIRSKLEAAGVATRPIIAGNFLKQPAAKSLRYFSPYSLQNANEIDSRGFMVGNHHNFTDGQVDLLIRALNSI